MQLENAMPTLPEVTLFEDVRGGRPGFADPQSPLPLAAAVGSEKMPTRCCARTTAPAVSAEAVAFATPANPPESDLLVYPVEVSVPMSDVIVDLAARRKSAFSPTPVEHPSGVILPVDSPADAALITSQVRDEISSGIHGGDLARLLPDAVEPGDRVLVIGAGLGIISTLAARAEGVDRVIAAEPNTALFPYLDRIHERNGATEVETLNAVLAVGKAGRIAFSIHRDPRTSSLAPDYQPSQHAATVPFMDLNMILAEERISLIVCDTPAAPVRLLAQAELGQVDRILLKHDSAFARGWEEDGICTQLFARGYRPEPSGNAILFRRSVAGQNGLDGVTTPANTNAAPVLPVWDRVDRQHGGI